MEDVGADKAELRRTGRSAVQIRSARCEAGLLGRADGSAKWTQGGTEIVVGVYGPRQTIASIEDAEKAAVQVTYSPKSGHAGPRERLLESFIRQTVEGAVVMSLNPRTLISITVQELSDHGAVLAVALNAVNAALADAGVALKYTFGAATCCKGPQKQLMVDPDSAEENEATALVTACFAISESDSKASDPDILATHAYGSSMTAEDFLQLKGLCYKVSEQAASLFRQAMSTAYR